MDPIPTTRPAPESRPGPRRRDVLGLAAAGCLTPLFARWAAAANDAKAADEFTFVVVNDIHYFDRRCDPFVADAVRRINGHKADFCLIVGDLTEDGTPEQTAAVNALLKDIAVPTRVVVGNHDYQVRNDDRQTFERTWPGSINYHFEHRGWQFVGLDTTAGRKGSETAIANSTLTYAADTLKNLDRKRPTVLFTHFPLGPFLPSRPTNANDLLAAFGKHTLRHVFNGHYHSSTERNWGDVPLTTNTCCSFHRQNHDIFDHRKGYFLCTAKDGHVRREYVQVNA